MSDFPEAVDDFVDESRVWQGQNDHAAIVIHGTGGNPDQTDTQLGAFFETTPDRTSVHYGIDRTGAIAQYVREIDGCGGEGILDPGHDPFWDQYSDNPNWHSLGVETENDLTNSLPLTDPQKQTLFRLVKYWVDKYSIPLSNIKGHFSLEPVNRVNCPGPNFPWDELWSYLNGEETMNIDINTPGVSTYFKASSDNKTWQCKNGNIVGGAILDFYKQFGGNALCGLSHLGLPLTNEIGVANHPGVTCQRFERGVLVYDPSRVNDSPPGLDTKSQVYLAHIDSGVGQDPRVTSLQALLASSNMGQINTLGKQISDDVALIQKLSQVQ